MTHTKGPWTTVWIKPDATKGHTFEPRCWITGIDPEFGEVRLADIPDPIDYNADANARLIAAAPEMLEALEGIFEHCSLVHKHWGEGCNQREANAAIKAASVAIAKAKGET